jgi:hypothetical protein
MPDITQSGVPDAETRVHHHADSEPTTDDCQPDCSDDCTAAVGSLTDQDRELAPSFSFKFEIDLDETADVADIPPLVRSPSGDTGPPQDLLVLATSTPVRRFDLQLE